MEKFKGNHFELGAFYNSNTESVDINNFDYEFYVKCHREDVHSLRLWLDRLDDSLNSNRSIDTDEDNWIPEDIYKNLENAE